MGVLFFSSILLSPACGRYWDFLFQNPTVLGSFRMLGTSGRAMDKFLKVQFSTVLYLLLRIYRWFCREYAFLEGIYILKESQHLRKPFEVENETIVVNVLEKRTVMENTEH